MASSSIVTRLGLGRRARATAEQRALEDATTRQAVDRKQLKFDMFTHISYLASLATAKASRDAMFTKAATLNLASSVYFHEINILVHRLKYDYSEACRAVAERVQEPDVAALLLRMSGSLSSGEDEAEFLTREAAVMAELYTAEYERDIESLRKWTDAYSALIVSAGLIVVVSIISMMIWTMGIGVLLATGAITIGVTAVGTWILYASSPHEGFTRKAGLTAEMQLKALFLMRTVAPAAAIAGSVAFMLGGLGYAFIVAGIGLLPAGWLMSKDSGRLSRLDADIATATRMLGGVTSAIGTTVGDALTKVDRRSLGVLEPFFRRLEVRVSSGISPDRSWNRFVTEAGSELIERTVRIFWDALTIGGEPGQTGKNAAFFAAQISLLRQKRALVVNTFSYLIIPLHAAMSGLLVFIVNVMALFAENLLAETADTGATGAAIPEIAATGGYNTFANVNFEFLNVLISGVIIAFTLSNAIAPWAAGGGHRIRAAFNLGLMMIIAGCMMAFIPPMARAIFTVITAPAS